MWIRGWVTPHSSLLLLASIAASPPWLGTPWSSLPCGFRGLHIHSERMGIFSSCQTTGLNFD